MAQSIFSVLFSTCGYGCQEHGFTRHTLLLFPASSNSSSVLEQIHSTWSNCAILHHPSHFSSPFFLSSMKRLAPVYSGHNQRLVLIKGHRVGIAVIDLHIFYLSITYSFISNVCEFHIGNFFNNLSISGRNYCRRQNFVGFFSRMTWNSAENLKISC